MTEIGYAGLSSHYTWVYEAGIRDPDEIIMESIPPTLEQPSNMNVSIKSKLSFLETCFYDF